MSSVRLISRHTMRLHEVENLESAFRHDLVSTGPLEAQTS